MEAMGFMVDPVARRKEVGLIRHPDVSPLCKGLKQFYINAYINLMCVVFFKHSE
jgi:hypothetical protein